MVCLFENEVFLKYLALVFSVSYGEGNLCFDYMIRGPIILFYVLHLVHKSSSNEMLLVYIKLEEFVLILFHI